MCETKNTHRLNLLKKIGIFSSLLCAVHCVVTPVFLAALPFLSSTAFNNSSLEVILIVCSLIIAGGVNFYAFIKHHRRYAPLAIMFLGISLLVSGQFVHGSWVEILFSTLGGLLLALSQIVSLKSVRNKQLA